MFNKLHFSDSFFVNGAVKITEIGNTGKSSGLSCFCV